MLKKLLLFLLISLVFIIVLIYNMNDSHTRKADNKNTQNKKSELNYNDSKKNAHLKDAAVDIFKTYSEKLNDLEDLVLITGYINVLSLNESKRVITF